MSLTFKGFNYVSYYNTAYSDNDSLTSLVSTNANAAALSYKWGINANTDTVYADSTYTPTLTLLGSTIIEAAGDGLSVMVRPLIDFLNASDSGSYGKGDFRAYFNPGAAGSAGANTFFASYQSMMVSAAEQAQADHAPLLCIGAELDGITGLAYKSYWTSIIDAIRNTAHYTGALTYSALWDDNLSPWQDSIAHTGLAAGTGNIATQVSFWSELNYVGIDEYAPLSNTIGSSTTNPTVAQLTQGWTQTPTDSGATATTYQVTGNQSLISYFESVSTATGLPLLFTEIGYPNATDAATQPYLSSTNVVDNTLQANLYQAFFDAWKADGNSSLAGVYFWNWDPNAGEVGPGHGVNFSPQGLAAQTVVTNGFAATLTEPIIVPQYGNGVIQLYTPDPSTGAPTLDNKYTVNVTTSILNTLFLGQGRIGAPNAVALHGNDLFFTNSSSNSQAVFELPNYLNNPTAAIHNAFVVTLDGSDYVGLAFDAAGHLYTAEGNFGDNQIVRYTLPTTPPTTGKAGDNYVTGTKTVIGDAGATSYFGDLTFDSSGNLWVADYLNSRVVAFNAANLGGTDTWHSITDVAGSLAVANTTSGLTAPTAHLFAQPEGVAFDSTASSADLWVGNNNDGSAGPTNANTLTSLVEITKPLQNLILATASDTPVSATNIKANNNVFIYNVPDNAGSILPQFGGVAIDTTAGVLYANEEIGGDVRAYTLSSIASTPNTASGTQLSMTTTNPGNGGLALVTTSLPCFREGTRLEGEHGPVAVEALRPGMRLRTAAGEAKPVRWIGHRRVDCRRHPRPEEVWPVRVQAHAFGPGMPHRDLWLSPDHAVLAEGDGEGAAPGVLIPIRYLVNGASVCQQRRDHVTYYHVELAAHEVLLAEGLPAESYLDTGNRAAFANGGTAVMATPDFARRVWASAACAPLVTDGPRLIPVRQALLRRAETLGHVRTGDAGLRLVADGSPLASACRGSTWCVDIPPAARQLTIVSRRFVPAHMEPASNDYRMLGVAVSRLALDGHMLAPADERLGAGWHAAEPGWRWTDGAAVLAVAGARTLAFDIVMTGRYWQETQVADTAAA